MSYSTREIKIRKADLRTLTFLVQESRLTGRQLSQDCQDQQGKKRREKLSCPASFPFSGPREAHLQVILPSPSGGDSQPATLTAGSQGKLLSHTHTHPEVNGGLIGPYCWLWVSQMWHKSYSWHLESKENLFDYIVPLWRF